MISALARLAAILALTVGIAAAQQFPFQILITSQGQQFTALNDTTIAFSGVEVGQAQSGHIVATYLPSNSANTATIAQGPALIGATQFTVTNFSASGKLPLTLNPGDQITFDVTFKPTSATTATAQLTMNFTETTPSAQSAQPTTTQNALVLIFQGTSPSFVLSYILQSNPNAVALTSGGTLAFGTTQVNTSALANLDVTNLGSGFGTISSITPPAAGSPFKVTGIPLPPIVVNAGQTLTLVVTYTPTASTTDNDQIQIKLASGTVLTVLLQGSGIASSYSYQIVSATPPAPVTPPGPIALPDTNVGSTNSIIVRVQNVGNATGTINSAPISAGAGFSVSGAPLFPDQLKPNDSFTFTITFSPTQPGAAKGTLIVGNDLFNLTGNGLGPQLTFSYTSGGGSITVNSGGTVVFSPAQVTQSEQDTFTVTNSGTQAISIANIGIGEAKSPFSVSGVQYPINLAGGASTQFTLAFAPTVTGFSNGTLRIDTNVINLTGSGTQPPSLPSFSFKGPSGNTTPQTQPGVSLSLSSGYPVALNGTLTLTTSSNSVSDPAVQFSTGGRTVAFVIPANATNASFAGQGSQIFLQTGTVAETIVLTPGFQTADGAIDLTPSPVTTLQFSVPTAAPTLLAVTVTGATTNSFTLNVTGFSTTRSVNSMTVQFTAAAGFSIGTNLQTTIDLTSSSAAWFQSTASQAFGGQFEVSVPFTFTGTNLPTGTTPIQAISSVSATVTNSVGTSTSLQVALQ